MKCVDLYQLENLGQILDALNWIWHIPYVF